MDANPYAPPNARLTATNPTFLEASDLFGITINVLGMVIALYVVIFAFLNLGAIYVFISLFAAIPHPVMLYMNITTLRARFRKS